MGMGKRNNTALEEVADVDVDAAALAERKAAKKAKKAAAAAAEAVVAEPAAEEEEDAEAAALAAKKAAKKAKKAAAAAAAVEAAEPAAVDEEDAALAAKKAAKKAKKAAAAAATEEDAEMAPTDEATTKPKVEKEDAKKAEPAKDAVGDDDEEWKDNTYPCCDCSQDWVDTVGEQQFRYEKGFAEIPRRCKDCRWAKKVRMEGGDPTAKGKGKKGGKSGGDENTVFIRGLPYSATEDVLTKDFSECGEIVVVRMPMDDEGSPRGFAFIKYADKEGMDKAMAFNETDYGGRTIYCSDAAIKPDGKGKGKGKDGKDGKGKDGKGKGKKGKKGKAPSESFAKASGAMVESTGKKTAFSDSDDE